MKRCLRLAGVVGLLICLDTRAYELQDIRVTREASRYRVHMDVSLDVPAASTYAAFADVRRLPQINPAVREVRVVRELSAGARRVYTRVRMCVSLFCRHIEQVQDMRFEASSAGGHVRAQVISELSDLRYGLAEWTLRACADRTCLRFDAEVEPDFWVPPLIGPWLIQRKLREEAMQTSGGLERLARELKLAR